MTQITPIREIRDYSKLIRNNPQYNPKNSYDWFRKQIVQLGTIKTQQYTQSAGFNVMIPGQMYLFQYYPKGHETLPVWDKFPLIIPWNKDDKGFIALNFHYLHPRSRLILLSRLERFKIMGKDNQHKLLLQWQFINNISKFPEVAPCVKRYLFSHMKSKLLKVPEEDWIITTQLPLQSFMGQKDTQVWQNSRKQIGR